MGRAASADVASATIINLEDADGDQVDVTGTTTIAGIILEPGHTRRVRFTGALTLTYGAATIVTPGLVDLAVAAGDIVTFMGDTSSTVRVLDVYRIAGPNAATVSALSTLTAADSGKTLFLSSGTEFVTTLPLPVLGLRFTFIVTAAPSGASYTIVSSASANIIKGQVYTLDVNSATDPDFEASGGDTISLVDAKAIAGDRVELFCDGTNWFAYGFCSVFDAITITTAS